MTIYAINVSDLSDCGGMISLLLADYCDSASPTVIIDKTYIDTGAIILDGNAANDKGRVAALIETLHNIGKRKTNRPIRCYKQGPRGGWSLIR